MATSVLLSLPMKLLVLLATSLLLVACAKQEPVVARIRLDLNTTITDTLHLRSLTSLDGVVDSATMDSYGVYTFNAEKLPPDIYRIESQQLTSLDIVWQGAEDVQIVARRNHLSQATTNHTPTQILWQTEALQNQLLQAIDTVRSRAQLSVNQAERMHAASQLKRLTSDARVVADTLLSRSTNPLLTAALLNLGNGALNVYNLSADIEIFRACAEQLQALYPNHSATYAMQKVLADARELSQFGKRYAPGNDGPYIEFIDKYATPRTTDEFRGLPYIIYMCNENTPENLDLWLQIALRRFDGLLILGLIPQEMDRAGKINTAFGTPTLNPLKDALDELQPIVIQVDRAGKITKSAIKFTSEDLLNW